MPRKAMKVIVELDIHTITCPGTFLRDYGYVYLKVNCMGLEVNTKSVPPTFPLFYHERLRFERVFKSCQDPAYVSIHLKGEDVLVELRQHDDYISDGYVIGHYANNARDFLYPAAQPYPGTGRELTLFKTSLFNPIRITGQPLRLEFSTKTTIKEVPDPDDFLSSDSGLEENGLTDSMFRASRRSISPSRSRSKSRSRSISPTRRSFTSTNRHDDTITNHSNNFLVRRKDNKLLESRDFSSFTRPKPRRSTSKSPTRRPRSASPSRLLGNSTVQSLPSWKYSEDFPVTSTARRRNHHRSATEPMSLSYSTRPASPSRSLSYALDDLNISTNSYKKFSDPLLRFKTRYSPNLKAALGASDRIQERVERILDTTANVDVDDDTGSVDSLDLLRDSLREERKALSDAIREADRAAYYKSIGLNI